MGDSAQEQRSEILDKVRGLQRSKRDAQGATADASTTNAEAPTDGSPSKTGSPNKTVVRIAPQTLDLEEPEEPKPQSIGSLGKRLSLLGSASPKALTRSKISFTPQP